MSNSPLFLDEHKALAATIFGVSINEVTPEMRSIAKSINFGIKYGSNVNLVNWRKDR